MRQGRDFLSHLWQYILIHSFVPCVDVEDEVPNSLIVQRQVVVLRLGEVDFLHVDYLPAEDLRAEDLRAEDLRAEAPDAVAAVADYRPGLVVVHARTVDQLQGRIVPNCI